MSEIRKVYTCSNPSVGELLGIRRYVARLPNGFVVDDAELKVMNSTDALDDRDVSLVHLHTCIHCGHSRSREEVEDREVSSGIFHCPKCGLDGPLNIEIRDLSA